MHGLVLAMLHDLCILPLENLPGALALIREEKKQYGEIVEPTMLNLSLMMLANGPGSVNSYLCFLKPNISIPVEKPFIIRELHKGYSV